MQLELDLSKHCIETELKRQHNRAVASYFRVPEKDRRQIEHTIDVSQQALSALDFGHLRATHPQLAGGMQADVTVREYNRQVDIIIDGTVVASFEMKRPD